MPIIRWRTLAILTCLATGAPALATAQAGPSPLAHTALGLVGGAVAGGLFARLSAGDGCVIDAVCDDGDYVVGIMTMAGTVGGAVVGAVVGALLPAGPRWLRDTATRPLRVAGVELRPELRVSFDDRRGK